VGLRRNRHLRALAARLPVVGAYERRVAELSRLLRQRSDELQRAHRDIDELAAQTRTWVPLGHFYSPVPDLDAIRAREAQIWGHDPALLPGVDLRLDEQWRFLDALAPLLADVSFAASPDEAAARGQRYWSGNPAFGAGDATWLTAMVSHFQPKRVVELGSGYSTACLLDARERPGVNRFELTLVEPHPELAMRLVGQPADVDVREQGTEDVDLGVFTALTANDVLFIDSTHVSRTGSDVNRIFFDILPALADGVIVHVHDVFTGFEYPPEWVYEGRAWSEQYVLHAFLQYNVRFDILLWPLLLWVLDRDRVNRRAATMAEAQGASLWLRSAGGTLPS
jgi:predicted O-methyltransferase YrrM